MIKSSLYPEQLLHRRAMGWAVKLQVNPEKVVIRRLSEKWGSCAPDGIVTFSEDLAREGKDFQDYVIVHELLHLRYRGHGRQFSAMMTALVPQWRTLEQISTRRTERRAEPGGGLS